MSYNIFFISDHHFAHSKPYNTFKREDGRFLRYEFANAQECDEAMIERHNKVVKPEDRVYFVGDVCFHKRDLHKVGRMNGRKVLIKGNHDLLESKDYLQYFDDIRGSHQFKGILVTHIPVHPGSLGRWGFNIHGHLHDRVVMREITNSEYPSGSAEEPDPRYFNVSVERLNYTPISLEEVKKVKPNE
jgi:calcineurin-like phosphoesterase family protein